MDERFESAAAFTASQFERVESQFTQLTATVRHLDERLTNGIDSLDARLGERIDSLDVRLSKRIESLDIRLSERIDSVNGQMFALATGLKPLLDETAARTNGESAA